MAARMMMAHVALHPQCADSERPPSPRPARRVVIRPPPGLLFTLFDANSGGSPVGSSMEKLAVAVTGGLFTVPDLDFGSAAFAGEARWLRVEVRCPAGSGSYTVVGGLQGLTATPYALYTTKAPWSGLIGVPVGFADGVDNDVVGALACGSGQVPKWNGAAWACAADGNTTYTAGSGLTLTGGAFAADTAYLQRRVSGTCPAGSSIRIVGTDGTVTCETDDAGWLLSGNAGTTPGVNFLGTTDDQALELKVNGSRALRIEPNTAGPNLVGGYVNNSVSGGVAGATIAGGGEPGTVCGSGADPCWNRVTANYGTVSGGAANTASFLAASIGGGYSNTASQQYAAVAGGGFNTASGFASAVPGGAPATLPAATGVSQPAGEPSPSTRAASFGPTPPTRISAPPPTTSLPRGPAAG